LAKPDWTRDELILALDLYFREPKARGSKSHPAVIELSHVLNNLPIHTSTGLDADFRNPSGVGMKLSNFLRFDPSYSGEGLKRGSHLEEEVWKRFSGDRDLLKKVASAIRNNMNYVIPEASDLDDPDDLEGEEGRILTRVHRARERNRKLVEEKKKQALKKNGKINCEACGFDYGSHYGTIGDGFAECHHIKPVSELKPGEKTKLIDLILLCANCHRMVHRRRPWLGFEELRKLLGGSA